ncbi:cation-transporting P-type ATPase [Chitinophaga sp. MM2321]|uniref:cation-transporting P-type ATPase n=1 Tax=Chitinophaga sp. MM2321 TaxID=3137178 RepID=UPI0032D5A9A1
MLTNQSLEEMQQRVDYIPGGLSTEEALKRLNEYGFNEIAREKPLSPWLRLWKNLKNPLVILLSILGLISFLTGDIRSTLVIFMMVILGIVLRYVQEMRADKAAEKTESNGKYTCHCLQRWKRYRSSAENAGAR